MISEIALHKPLLIFGTGQYADLAHYYFSQHAGRHVEAFTVEAAYVGDGHFRGLPVLDFVEAQRRHGPATHDLFVAIGYTQRNQVRRRIFMAARSLGYTLPSFVHETAHMARNVVVGANSMVREFAVLSPFATLGENLFVGSQACVSHHVRLDSHCYLSSTAIVCGMATVEEGCFIGAHATIRNGITVGAGCVVGAGALIMADCEPDGLYCLRGAPRQGLRRR